MRKQHRTAKENYPPTGWAQCIEARKVLWNSPSDEADVKGHVPIYIYDRLDEPTRDMLEAIFRFRVSEKPSFIAGQFATIGIVVEGELSSSI